MSDALDLRLHALKAVDVILAALQTAFAEESLIEGQNPYRYLANDPKNSKLFICDPEGRTGFDRSGNRLLICVYRTDFQPQNLHMHNHADGASDGRTYSDLCNTNVYIQCEAGNKTQSEALASIVYQILKMFRLDLMREFDIFNLNPSTVGAPTQLASVKGEPWSTTVSVQVQTQESYHITELANHMNHVKIRQTLKENVARTMTLDANPDGG